MNEKPIMRQLLICEKSIIEDKTANVSLINCFSVRTAGQFPTEPIAFKVFGVLTDGFGTFTMQLRIARLDSGEDIYQQTFQMQFMDRLEEVSLIVHVDRFVFPVRGRYQVDLLLNGEMIGMTSLHVRGV